MNRIYHTWDKWECYPAGFYEDAPPRGMSAQQCKEAYAEFLRDSQAFRSALSVVLETWRNSCEHYLSNVNMNRIAWLGQAALCVATGIPAAYRSGYHLLSEADKMSADLVALEALNKWLADRGEGQLTLDGAASKTEANLY